MDIKSIEDLMAVDYRLLSGDEYTSAHKVFNEAFPRELRGLYDGGAYWEETNQMCITICMDQNLPFLGQAGRIKSVIRLIKPLSHGLHAHEAGCLVLKIFESSCSEYGIYYLTGHPNGVWKVSINSFSRSTIKKEGELDDCLQYIYDHHPYIWKGAAEGYGEDD